MRRVSLACLLPLLLFVTSTAEAARISFATKDCGTPPLLGLTFAVDANGQSTLLNPADACPGEVAIPGDLVGDDGVPFYGPSIASLDLTISSLQGLDVADFEVGDFFGVSSLDFTFGFTPATSGGGVLSVLFTTPIAIPCTIGPVAAQCRNLDLLIFIDGDDGNPLDAGSLVSVTAVNETSVPEPSTLALLGIGAAAAARRRRTSGPTP